MDETETHPDDVLLVQLIRMLVGLSKENRRRIIQALAGFFEVKL
jgi:hypothetical protein